MSQKELESLKEKYKELEDKVVNSKLEIDIQENKKRLYEIKKYREYIEELQIGEDGTVFGAKSKNIQKNYSLSFLFNCALSLKYYGSDKKEDTGLSLTVKEFILYLENAEQILRSLKKYPNDLIENNPYNLNIIKNPKSTKVLEESEYLEFLKGIRNTKKNDMLYTVLLKYNVSPAVIYKKDKSQKPSTFMVLSRNIRQLDLINIKNLTSREQNAFFGLEAQQILNVNINLEETNSKSNIKY